MCEHAIHVSLVGDDMDGGGAERDGVDLGRGAGRGRTAGKPCAGDRVPALLGGGGGSTGAEEWSKWGGWELVDRGARGGLAAGSYLVCARVEGRPLLDPCEWAERPPAWNLRVGEAARVQVVMARGVWMHFRVRDEERELERARAGGE